MENNLAADHYAHSMSKFCPGVRAYYIPGVKCMLKANTFPQAGYANGSQGRMIGLVHEDPNYVLPSGFPGEMIMIPPPRFIIMEVHHIGKEKRTSILPCEMEATEIEYYRDSKKFIYRCWSNMVVLTFALTVHETQGQTLRRIILLLGRLPGMNVGRITWSLLYVALSRTKKLSHIKLFPTGSTKYYQPMYFAHLLKLSMPVNLKRWHRSYVDHRWDRNILRNEHAQSVRKVERKLKQLGESKTKTLKWAELFSLVKQMRYKATTRDNKMILFCKLKEHMVKRLLWKTSKSLKPANRRGVRVRKRKAQELESERCEKSNSSLRQSNRLRRSTQSKKLPNPRQGDHLERPKKKQRTKKYGKSEANNFFPQLLHPECTSFYGLKNLGQTCYFNSIVQCLFHCPLFREAINNVPQPVFSVAVLRELRLLFSQMGKESSSRYLDTLRCFSAAINIPECKEANMNKNRQEDAGEFFLRLIEHFSEKFKPLADIFEGDLRSTLTCQRCFQSYTKTDPFRLLALSFPERNDHNVSHTHDVYDFLNDFVRSEIISGYDCAHCPTQNQTEKTLDILSTPKVLVLQLKRFKGLQKMKDFVKFPSKLRLKYASVGDGEHQLYCLTGIVCHRGSTITNGHYLSYILVEEKWLKADDETIREVRYETVKREEAYLLFYVRL